MKRDRRPSPQTAAVIASLAEEPELWRYGYDLCRQLGMKAGSMYPILIRLADRGLLETRWTTETEPGRPPRHLYRLTGTGLALAARLTAVSQATPDSARASSAAVSPLRPGPRLAGEHP
jgi:PadR family transcriptional regulator, regulatory protein PadR